MTKLSLLKSSLKQLLIAIDQLIHSAIGLILVLLSTILPIDVKLWYADETLSSHCWRLCISGKRDWPRMIVDTLFFCESTECSSGHHRYVTSYGNCDNLYKYNTYSVVPILDI